MGRERYLTENPFRVLGVSSNITQREVSRKAAAAAKSAAVGLVTEPPFEKEFGPADFDFLSANVRSMATDCVLRTVYRLFWPSSENSLEAIMEAQGRTSQTVPPDEFQHVRFLVSWYKFLQTRTAERAKEALIQWKVLDTESRYSDLAGTVFERLVSALIEDDGISNDLAGEHVRQAADEITDHLLYRISAAADQMWADGETQQSLCLVKTVLESAFDERKIVNGLAPIISTGDSVAKRIGELIQGIPDYEFGEAPPPTPKDVERLSKLSGILSDVIANARRWDEQVLEWNRAVVSKMLLAAMLLSKRSQSKKALSVIKTARMIALDPETVKDIDDLSSVLANGLRPLARAPRLFTINGIGCKLYGKEPFAADLTKHFSILYLTIFYIPFFPVTRYLVQSAGANSWNFFGRAKWTIGMKVHLGVAFFVILYGIVMIATANRSGESNPGAGPSAPVSSIGSDNYQPHLDPSVEGDAGGKAEEVQDPDTLSRQNELVALTPKLESINSKLESDDKALAVEKQRVETLGRKVGEDQPNLYDKQQVDSHNQMVAQYNRLRALFNRRVGQYNKELIRARKMQKRVNELMEKLNKEGG